MLESGSVLVKYTVSRDDECLTRRWYDMPDKTEFDAYLTRMGVCFEHDEPRRYEAPGIVFDVYRYTLIGEDTP